MPAYNNELDKFAGFDAQVVGMLEEVPGARFHEGIGDHQDGLAVAVAQAALEDDLYRAGLHGAIRVYLILCYVPIIYGNGSTEG